jgi:patatin-like phospholipase/acyl hydrolase
MISEQTKAERFQILSLDGGGIKGIFSAAVLAALERDLTIDITDHFDLIAGTSTGGIIALGLGLGMRPHEILDFYLEEGPKIFPKWFGIKSMQHWLFRKYSPWPLEAALRAYFGERLFGESKKRLVVPSYNIGEDDVYLFRTPHHSRLKRDFKVPAWKIGVATSAAPTFFPCYRGVDSVRLVDGGVWANNPTMVGIVEAYGTLGASLDSLWVLNIGTSDEVAYRHHRLNRGGILSWAWGNAALKVIMKGQSMAADKQAGHLIGRDHVERLSPVVAAKVLSLDGVHKADDLVGKAAHFSRSFVPVFAEKFQKHVAAEYKPLYKL